jgi:predicted acylesterase/phospholipase RssA
MSGPESASRGRLGLVLGGGAALGAAHAGVLQVLEEADISCPIVAGTSAGALIGAAYAAGLPSQEITDAVLTAGWADFAMPCWAARALGADLVIAVSLDQDLEPAATTSGRLLEAVRKHHPHPAAVVHLPPDVLIRPDTDGLPHWSPKGVPQLVAAGRHAAEAALPAISALVASRPGTVCLTLTHPRATRHGLRGGDNPLVSRT